MTLELIDTHAHLTYSPLADNPELILARARAAEVAAVVTVGTSPDDSHSAIGLAEKFDNVFAVIGIHPHEADKFENLELLRELTNHPKVLALGETGLDYHYQFAQRVNQQRLFQTHLELAHQVNLPVVVHCREAFEDVLRIIKSAPADIRGAFHCFSGDVDQARQVLDMGWFISFSGTVTFKNADKLRQSAKFVGLDRLLIETDCPYLSPEPVRKIKINEPSHLVHTARALAELFGLAPEAFAEHIRPNATRLFGPKFKISTGSRK